MSQKEECQLESSNVGDGINRSQSADDVSSAAVDAHRQRVQLQTHVMDGLKRLEIQAHSNDIDSPMQCNDIHQSSWRCRDMIRHKHLPASQCVNSAVHCETVYQTLSLDKMELDKANKDKQHKLFPADFKVWLSQFLYAGVCYVNISLPNSG